MSIRDFLLIPCTLVADGEPTGATDDMGEPVGTSEVSVATVCDLQQTSARESRDGGIIDVTTWRLYLPPPAQTTPIDVTVTATARVHVDDRIFSLEGSGWLVRDDITGTDSHVEAVVTQVR